MSNRDRVVFIWLAFLTFSLWLGQGAGRVVIAGAGEAFTSRIQTAFVHKPYLYRIEKDGHVSYLLGTHHVGLRLNQFPASVREALQQMPVFAAENLSDDDVEPRTSHMARFEKGLLTKAARANLEKRGLQLEKFSASDSILKVCSQYTFWEAQPEWAQVDKELEDAARAGGKKRIALDTAEDMTRVLENATRVCEPHRLAQDLPPEQARANFSRAFENYLSGKESFLAPNAAADEFMLLSVRNGRWLEKIERVHREGVFVAVGALHLGGPRGLLAQLGQRGFRVSRVDQGTAVRTASVSR